MAEKKGFEPLKEFDPLTVFPGQPFQPLTHFSMETTVGIKPTQFPFAEEPVIIPARRRIFYIGLLA